MGRLGLEGMTAADIAEMDADNAKEWEHYHREMGKRLRWMKRDTPWRHRIYRLLDFLGFGYGAAYMAGTTASWKVALYARGSWGGFTTRVLTILVGRRERSVVPP